MSIPVKGSQTIALSGLSEAATKLGRLLPAHIVSRAIQVATELDLASHIGDDDKSCTELAALCGAHAPTLSRLMRMLVSVGVFADNNRRFTNNDVSALLRSDVPQSMRAWACMLGADFQWSTTQALMHSVLTGKSACQHVFGDELFSYLSRHPDKAQLFDAAMVVQS